MDQEWSRLTAVAEQLAPVRGSDSRRDRLKSSPSTELSLSHWASGGTLVQPAGRVNLHQPSCLPNRFDFMIGTVHSNVHGQVAVTHPGRWTYLHEGG